MRRPLISLAVFIVALPLLASFSGTDVFIGSVGRGPGAGGSDWYTSVWIHNPGTAPASVVAYLLLRNQTNPTPAAQTVVVQPGETRRLDNIVETLFGQTNVFGAMRFTSTSRVFVSARIYSKPLGAADSESAGQSFDGVPSAFAIGPGQSTIVVGVHQTAPLDTSQFRYNYGFVETAGGSGALHVSVSDSAGTPVGAKDYSVGPYEARQFGIADVIPAVNSTNLRLTISVSSGTARVIAFGSGIANHSNDPTTFDMSFRDDLLAGPAAATNVKHDATLTGDGSDATPLGVADLGVGSAKINSTGGSPGMVLTAGGGNTAAWAPAPGLTLPYHAIVTPPSFDPQFQLENKGTAVGAIAIYGSALNGVGVMGVGDAGTGTEGISNAGPGVFAVSVSGAAVRADSTSGPAVLASSENNIGVSVSSVREGVKAISTGSHGVYGESRANDFYGVVGFNTVGNHVGLIGTLGYAGDFVGDVRVKGNLSKFSGSFTIDHPLDPEHKTLSHSFVESPDMKNVYDGVVVTDNEGFAVVELPDWFEALNRDFRYQLTVIGRFAQAIVDTEIANNRFTIRTDHPSVKVSWQVTGIRRDPWANAHRIVVEQEKPPDEQGYYLAPEVYDQPPARDVFWAKHPELRRR